MQLLKQDIGVWVDVNDRSHRMPKDVDFEVKFDNGEIKMFSDEAPFAVVTHWLKPIKDVYVLTESEMIKLIDAAIRSNSLTAQYFLEEKI